MRAVTGLFYVSRFKRCGFEPESWLNLAYLYVDNEDYVERARRRYVALGILFEKNRQYFVTNYAEIKEIEKEYFLKFPNEKARRHLINAIALYDHLFKS